MKRVSAGILIALVLAAGAFKAGSEILTSRRLKAEAARVEAARRAQLQRSLAETISKHNAVTDWQKSLSDQAQSRYHVYTVEIQHALSRHDGRPIFFLGGVRDVAKRDGKYYAVLDGWTDLAFSITFILELQPEQVELLLDDCADPLLDMYAVVAAIGSVEGTPLRLVAHPSDGDDAEISLDSEGSITARGTCLDLLFIGRDWVQMESIIGERGVR